MENDETKRKATAAVGLPQTKPAMAKEAHPAKNPILHGQAEQAALEAYLAASPTDQRRRMKLMDRAAARVFKAAGTPRELANFYASSVTALVLQRMSVQEGATGQGPGLAGKPTLGNG